MAKLKIDGDMLAEALESHDDGSWYLDLETGEFLLHSHFGDNDLLNEEELEAHSERYRYVEPIDSFEGFRIMEDFVETLPEGEAKHMLARALTRPKPFRNFKDDLYEVPDVRQQWFEYHHKAMWKMAEDWLRYEEIDAEMLTGPEFYKDKQ